ncbi:hypothetical protein LLH23_04755 [bacterium]|nr:hypothetical protein [bacterium]
MGESIFLRYPWLGGLLVVAVFGLMMLWVTKLQEATRAASGPPDASGSGPAPASLRGTWLSRFLLLCVAGALLTVLGYLDAMGTRGLLGLPRGTAFEFILGAFVSPVIALAISTVTKVHVAWRAAQLGLPIRTILPPWVALENWALHLASIAVLLALPLLFGLRPFFIGGVAASTAVCLWAWGQARAAHRRPLPPSPPPVVPPPPPDPASGERP